MQTRDIERDIRKYLVDEFFHGQDEKLRNDGSLLGGVIDSTEASTVTSPAGWPSTPSPKSAWT